MKKNLLYIFADQWRAQAAEHMNADQVKTPNITEFLKESYEFTNSVSTYPLCSPHRASLLTGKYPLNCGMWTNCKTGLSEILTLKAQETTISDVLFANGYQNGYIGKYHLDASDNNFKGNKGRSTGGWDAFTPPGERRHHFDFWYSYGAMDRHMNPYYYDDNGEKIVHENKWSVELETEIAIDYMKNAEKDKPFSLFVSWNPPHPPYDPVPDKYYDKYKDLEIEFRENVPRDLRNDEKFKKDLRKYFAAVEGVDDNFGKIIKFLKENDLYDNTLVILSSDHGNNLGSHRIFDKNNWYDESALIPLYIGGAGIKGGKSDLPIGSIDHMPTILDFLDVDIPETVQGISFASILRGETMLNEPDSAFICMFPGMPAMVNNYDSKGLNSKCFGWRGIRTKELTYVVNNGTVPGEPQTRLLYDNIADPYQLNPTTLFSNQSSVYDKKLKAYLDFTGDPFLLEI